MFFLKNENYLNEYACIQVVVRLGISVFIDGDFQGVTTAEYERLIIENVKPRQRLINLLKKQFFLV